MDDLVRYRTTSVGDRDDAVMIVQNGLAAGDMKNGVHIEVAMLALLSFGHAALEFEEIEIISLRCVLDVEFENTSLRDD